MTRYLRRPLLPTEGPPCPWCGAEAKAPPWVHVDTLDNLGFCGSATAARVECHDCQSYGPIARTEAQAIILWSTRP